MADGFGKEDTAVPQTMHGLLEQYILENTKSDLKSAKILFAAEEIRHASDYDDFYVASKEESEC